MKIIFKILIAFVVLLLIAIGLVIGAREGYLDKQIKKVLEFYLSNQNVRAQLEGLHITHKGFVVSKLSFPLDDNTKAEAINLIVHLKRGTSLKSPAISAEIESGLRITNIQDEEILNAKLSAQYFHKLFTKIADTEITFSEIKSSALLDPLGANLPAGTAFCTHTASSANDENAQCKIEFGDKSSLIFSSNITRNGSKIIQVKADASIKEIPLTVHHLFGKILPANKASSFLNEYIKSGHITFGEFKVNLDQTFFEKETLTPENLVGKFNVTDLEFKYDNDFPAIKKMNIDALIEGPSIKLQVSSAYSSDTLISNGNINLDWTGVDSSKLLITATAKGNVVDLTDFIPREAMLKMKQMDIDLRKFAGIANSKIDITIPFKEGTLNSYNITTEITGGALNIFDSNVELKNAKFSGSFDGEKIVLNGTGKINNFDSDLSYQYNLIDQTEYEQLLSIKTKIKDQYQKVGIIKMLSGKNTLNFEYKVKDDKTTISANSDLQNLNFYIDKLGIHKPYGRKANFILEGSFDEKKNTPITFALTGEDNLKIVGNITLSDKSKTLVLPTITYKKTDVNAEIIFDKDNFKASIRGALLDLSEADMLHFLEKGKDSSNTNVKVKVQKIRLKNDIWLNDVAMSIKCNPTKCYKGYLNSQIGTKFFKMLLKTFEDKEEWVLTSNNAGAVFRGFDLYSKMKSGSMILTLNTSRQEVKKGEVVPILDGRFGFKKFIVTDTPFLTRIVSFISLPGFFNMVTNNKDIVFSDMKGKFSYNNQVINISKGSAEGPFFDFTIAGSIDTSHRKIKLKGHVVPSVYGISTLIKHIPLLGKLLSGGHRKGILSAPFSVEQSY